MGSECIKELDDKTAVSILSVFAEAHQQQAWTVAPSREMVAALNATLEEEVKEISSPNDGEAARQALMLLAEDPRFADPIEALLDGPFSMNLVQFAHTVMSHHPWPGIQTSQPASPMFILNDLPPLDTALNRYIHSKIESIYRADNYNSQHYHYAFPSDLIRATILSMTLLFSVGRC